MFQYEKKPNQYYVLNAVTSRTTKIRTGAQILLSFQAPIYVPFFTATSYLNHFLRKQNVGRRQWIDLGDNFLYLTVTSNPPNNPIVYVFSSRRKKKKIKSTSALIFTYLLGFVLPKIFKIYFIIIIIVIIITLRRESSEVYICPMFYFKIYFIFENNALIT